ncbi:phage tail terminator-like protein [Sneathiella sp.]|jgi:hypothetical protein|uniref:phage tail terminator-like protein n=1 Tax=Sneathiella sp. TaxID=1964365 RepID=UPI0039E2A17E
MSYRRIRAALDQSLQDFSGPEIVFPSTAYKPAHGQDYIEVDFNPGTAKSVFLGPSVDREYRGELLLSIRARTVYAAIEIADQLRAHFAPGTVLAFEGLKVTVENSRLGKNRGGVKFVALPLSVNWRSYF